MEPQSTIEGAMIRKNSLETERRGVSTILDREEYLSSKELAMEKYKDVVNWRDKKYEQDVEADPSKKNMYLNLKIHNDIVLDYASKLTEKEDLSPQEKGEALMATIMHDSGKLSSSVLDHHEKGVEYAAEMLEQMKGQKIGEVEVTEESAKKITDAIERHMNHPFMVMSNKGERFPEPQNKVDKIVFDADMLANIGFKNVAFRLINEGLMDKDTIRAKDGKILEESFRNVFEGEITDDGKKIPGASGLQEVVLSSSAKEIAGKTIEAARAIFEHLKGNGGISEVQKIFSDEEGNFNSETIKKKGGSEGMSLIKKMLNEKIQIAAMDLGIEMETARKFEM